MNSYKDKVVWITGASSGIGKAFAKILDDQGARLVLSSRNEDKLNELERSLKGGHLVLPLDLADSSNFETLVSEVIDKFGQIDILINNGGLSQRSEAKETPIAVDREIMEVNYFGNIALTKAVLPYMIDAKAGKFIVISSIAGKFGFFLRSAYSASKHALHGFYESLRLEEEANNIEVLIACPGKINTDISKNALTGSGKQHGQMDHNQETGMSSRECASQILKASLTGKYEVLVGNKEIKAVYLKRFFPKMFWKIIKKQSPT